MWNLMWRGTLLDELAGLQTGWNQTPNTGYPGFRFYENDDGLVLRAEIPGVRPEDIDVQVRDNILTATIEKRPEEIGEGARVVRGERRVGKFTRSFELPFHANTEAVQADYRHGVLTLRVPRAEEEKPRRIAVQAG